jgi:hypothetical protein
MRSTGSNHSSIMILPENERPLLKHLRTENPDIFEIGTSESIEDQVSSLHRTFKLFSFIKIEMMRDSTTPDLNSRFFPTSQLFDVFELYIYHIEIIRKISKLQKSQIP